MKFQVAIAFFAVVAVAAAGQEAPAETLKFDSVVNPDSFQYAYETSNGIRAEEKGQLKQIGSDAGIAVQGSYSYTGDDGVTYTVSYGQYRPSGDDGRYLGGNDGKYSGNDGKYVHQPDKFGSNGKVIVNIGGGKRPLTKVSPPSPSARAPSKSAPFVPLAPLPSQSSPPRPQIIFLDPRVSGVNVNEDEPVTLGAAAAEIKTLRQEQEETENGYRYLYETENGILAEESGQIEKTETGDDALSTTGFYQYIGDDGKQYRVDYRADVNGFVATAEHLPTPPPIPPEIEELLRILATKQPDTE